MLCAVLNKFEYRIDIIPKFSQSLLSCHVFIQCVLEIEKKKNEKERRGGFNINLRNFNSMH